MKRHRLGKIAVFVVASAMLIAPKTEAALTFTLDTSVNGTAPTSASPWLTATFQDSGANVVTLTLTASLEVTSEFISDVGFNIRPGLNASGVTIVNTTPANPMVVSIVNGIHDSYNLIGSGNIGKGFDIGIAWSTANSGGGVRRFNGSDVEVFTFTITGLTAADFNYANQGGLFMGAHVQGIPTGDGSGAIAAIVPEPTTMIAGALLLLPFAATAIRRFRKS